MPAASRPAGTGDAVLGVAPRAVWSPAGVAECAEALAACARDGSRVAFAGGGTELDLGRPPEALDALVRSERLARIVEYAPADMVMVVEAGATLAQVQAAARAHGQMLALDPPLPERATVGGLVATAGFGPRRERYGAVRDLIIGVTLVRADGAVARGGGKVVKNVAGFDMPKLACGSLGTLGMIAAAAFRLHPLPEAAATAVAAGVATADVVARVAAARKLQLEPARVVALRCEAGGWDLAFGFEGFAQGVAQQLARAPGDALADDAAFWRRHDEARAAAPLRVKVAAPASRLAAVEALLAPLLAALRRPACCWYATLGLGFAGGEPDGDVAAALLAARAGLEAEGGSLVVETAPAAVRAAVDPWGTPPPAFALMRELKRRFDPERRLNPGRFVGGL